MRDLTATIYGIGNFAGMVMFSIHQYYLSYKTSYNMLCSDYFPNPSNHAAILWQGNRP